ncbi:MAG: DUF5989 family protein, partial [Akkermansiaceae bacterium]
MTQPDNEFEKAAQSGESQRGLLREFVSFLGENKKWWLAPILIVLLLFGILIMLAGTGAAPYIYT